MSTTRMVNVGDASGAQDAVPLHQVQAIANAAAVPATAGAVAIGGHAAESVLVSIAGTVSDLALTASTVVGRGASGDIVAVPFATILGGGSGITALTGDVVATGPGSAAATIQPLAVDTGKLAAAAVTNAKRANMAASTLSGNATGSPAAPTDLTAAAVKTLLAISFADIAGTLLAAQFPALTGDVTTTAGSLATTLTNLPQTVLITRTAALTAALPMNAQKITGLADPASPQDAATKHYVDASFSGGVPLVDGNKGDITVSGSGATWLINLLAVTFAKMQNIPTQTLVGRQTAGSGSPESIGVGGGVEFDGSGNIRRSALTGDVSASAGSAGTVINPNVVTNSQLAQVPTATLKGRSAAGTGNVTDLTAAAVKTLLAISFADVSGTLAAGQFPALTGDVTTTAGSLATTLAATGVSAGTFGDGSHSLTLQVDAKGRMLAISAPSISITAGAVSGLSTTQTGALTGDVTKPAGSGTTTLVNVPNDTTVPGDILGITSAAPATPGAGCGRLWFDSTDSIWKNKDESGNVTHMTRARAAASHLFITGINADGSVDAAQPAAADVTGLEPIATNLIPANSIIGNNTGSPTSALALTAADVRAFIGVSRVYWNLGLIHRVGSAIPGSIPTQWLAPSPSEQANSERGFPFAGAGASSTIQALEANLYSFSLGGAGVFQWVFTLQVDGVDTALTSTVVFSSGTTLPLRLQGNSATLTIPDGSSIGVKAVGSVIAGSVTVVNSEIWLGVILR